MVTNVTGQILLVEPMRALDALAHLDGVDLAPINVLLGTIALAVRTPLATFDMFTKTLRGAEGILAAGRTGTLRSKMRPLVSKLYSKVNISSIQIIIVIIIITNLGQFNMLKLEKHTYLNIKLTHCNTILIHFCSSARSSQNSKQESIINKKNLNS